MAGKMLRATQRTEAGNAGSGNRAARCVAAVLVCLAWTTKAPLLDDGFTVHGRLEYTNHVMAAEHYVIRYTMSVQGARWKLSGGQFGKRAFGYTEHGCDGVNLYSLTYYNTLPIEEARKESNLLYFVNGRVVADMLPPFDPIRSIHIWFAYAGLHALQGGQMKRIACRLTTPREVPQCFRTIVLKTNESTAEATKIVHGEGRDDGYDYDSAGKPVRLPPPWNEGY